MTRTDELLTTITRADRTRGMRDLAARLGFAPAHLRVTRDLWPGLGLDPDSLDGSLFTIGTHPAATACALVTPVLCSRTARAAARCIQSADVSRHVLLIAADARFDDLLVAATGPDDQTRSLRIHRARPRHSDAETLAEMHIRPDDGTASIAARFAHALDRAHVSARFFDDFRDHRSAIAAAWTGIPTRARADRDQLALLFLCRLMFLYFLQHAGHLGGNPAFLPTLVHRRRPAGRRRSIFRATLLPLFFGALNRRPDRRTDAARRLGPLPYLNGGLFERHTLERRFPRLDLPDPATLRTFDQLLERYRFTTREPADSILDASADGGIDPEMLGRVFEGVMNAERRSSTGAFYTPASAVDSLTREALTAWLEPHFHASTARALVDTPHSASHADACAAARLLATARILDPACGSGAFLLGALARVTAIRRAAGSTDPRRDIIADSLHGVDLDPDAALLCALRLWLALAHSDGPVRPLPNLDRRIRQGDALLDPIDLALANSHARPAHADLTVRRATTALEPLARAYIDAEPGTRDRLRTRVERQERAVARAWIRGLRSRTRFRIRELAADAAARDLFGQTPASARSAAAALPAARNLDRDLARLRNRLRDDRATPFFSFHVHFADTAPHGFDLILSNPPWVRAHRWPRSLRSIVRNRYDGRTSGWSEGARLAGAPAAAAAQTDLALLFVDRALSLLADGGVLAMLLPARTLRSLYAGSTRARLLHQAHVLSIRDHGLDHHAIFRADAFAAAITARRPVPASPPPRLVSITITGRHRESLHFAIPRDELPLFPDQPASPWLLAPDSARAALRHMQTAGPPLGLHSDLRTRRGVFTGANHVFLVDHATPHLGGLASIRAAGFRSAADDDASAFEAVVESRSLRPVIRGADLRAWAYDSPRLIFFLHDRDGRPEPPPTRTRRYFDRHREALLRRSGSASGFPDFALFRVTRDTLAPKVAWQDLAPTLEATPLPATCRSPLGDHGPLIPLNTTYFIPTPDDDSALLLAAFLNATPTRVFARTIAERAKDARFRFFAWTIACLPLPTDWRRHAASLLPIARQARADNGLDPDLRLRLDQAVAQAFNLSHTQLEHLLLFDHWLGDAP